MRSSRSGVGQNGRTDHREVFSHAVGRPSSKKSSSQDRYGKVYTDTFEDPTTRMVMQESSPGSSSAEATQEPEISALPPVPTFRSSHRAKLASRRRGHSTSVSNTDEESTIENRRRKQKAKPPPMEEQALDTSPNSFILKTRQRLGSITTGGYFASKPTQDFTDSIGYPSIIQNPPFSSQSGSRQSLTRPFSNPSSPQPLESAPTGYGKQTPFVSKDSKRVLQLMRLTCGRMHGFLFYRRLDSPSWSSGYCAINVASGSLIYQARVGKKPLTETLIPDLRGCKVHTSLDEEKLATCISVSTRSPLIGIQLRPPVPETFDSWLAALLCWQPLPPEGMVNISPASPSTSSSPERPTNQRRKTSESSSRRTAAVIKVGQMRLFSGCLEPSSLFLGLQAPGTDKEGERSSPWRKVSCSLHENGSLRLSTVVGNHEISTSHLSRLKRSAVQPIDRSVLNEEFCIAVFPKYCVPSSTQRQTKPIYLALESRVLFEVWFVLLRAFTVPEIYGSDPSTKQQPSDRHNSSHHSQVTSSHSMWRLERSLSVRIIEAKLKAISNAENVDDVQHGRGLDSAQSTRGDFYAEVVLDGEIRARTASKTNASTAFWREEFQFCNLPPDLSEASIVVRARNPAEREWTMIAHGDYDLSHGANDPMTVIGEIEVVSHDAVYGSVLIPDLNRKQDVERWWPIVSNSGIRAGEILMKLQTEETVVLFKDDYSPLWDLLHNFSNGLTTKISQVLQKELKPLSDIFLDIFQVSGYSGDWIMSLVDDEIDGIHRHTPVSRLRFSSRIHSNDSYEAAENREMLVRDLGRTAQVEANLLFRGNSLLTKALDTHMRRLGREYLEETIGHRIREIDEDNLDCEVDPNRVGSQTDLSQNWEKLIALTSSIWDDISCSADRCPSELRTLFRHIGSCAEDRYGVFLRTVSYSSVSGFLFLRFFCPAVLNPKLFGVLKEHPKPKAHRTLTLIAKSLIGLANMTTFGNKEPFMEPMNKFILASKVRFKEFVDGVCSIPSSAVTKVVSPSYATPIQILGRLPQPSREGFPSLPYLIDSAKRFSNLVSMWLDHFGTNEVHDEELDDTLRTFHDVCIQLQRRTEDCLASVRQAPTKGNGEHPKEEGLPRGHPKSHSAHNMLLGKPGPVVAVAMSASAVSEKRHSSG